MNENMEEVMGRKGWRGQLSQKKRSITKYAKQMHIKENYRIIAYYKKN